MHRLRGQCPVSAFRTLGSTVANAGRLRGFVGQQCLENRIVGSEDYLVARHEDSRCPEDVLGHFAVDGKLTQSDATSVVEICSAFCGDAGAGDVLALFLG